MKITQAEFERNKVAPYGLIPRRIGRVEGESKVTFEHYDDGSGKEFVVMKCSEDDVRTFVPGDIGNILGPIPTDATPGRTYR